MPDHRAIWINGPFGVGKTMVAGRLIEFRATLRTLDPETVGTMLMANLADRPPDDFQDLPAWRLLVPVVAGAIVDATSQDLVVVQTVTDHAYWSQLEAGMAEHGILVTHVVLDCAETELRRRIQDDGVEHRAYDWRVDHIDRFAAARPWLQREADLYLDTTLLTIDEVANRLVLEFA